MRIVPEARWSVKPGQMFDMLEVLGKPFYAVLSGKQRQCCVCECKCGRVIVSLTDGLVSGDRSCGCRRKELARKACTTHGGHKSKIYGVWREMRQRCEIASNKSWKNYGGRGITVVKEWGDFAAFQEWAAVSGYREGLMLDRENNDLGYSPQNCRWVTRAVQNRNHRRNRWIEAFGKRLVFHDWEKEPECAVCLNTVEKRLKLGWTAEAALSTPGAKPYELCKRKP